MNRYLIPLENIMPRSRRAAQQRWEQFLLRAGMLALAGSLAACSDSPPEAPAAVAPALPAPAPASPAQPSPAAAPAPAPAAAATLPVPVDPMAVLAQAMSTPAGAAETFYRTKQELKIDGLPQEWQLAGLTGTITPELHRVIDKACFTQAAFIINKKEGTPPWMEGDQFSSLPEGVTTFQTGAAAITGDSAEVPLALTSTANGRTTTWTDHVLLKQVKGSWLVDDLRFGGTWDTAPRGTLRQRLTPPAS